MGVVAVVVVMISAAVAAARAEVPAAALELEIELLERLSGGGGASEAALEAVTVRRIEKLSPDRGSSGRAVSVATADAMVLDADFALGTRLEILILPSSSNSSSQSSPSSSSLRSSLTKST